MINFVIFIISLYNCVNLVVVHDIEDLIQHHDQHRFKDVILCGEWDTISHIHGTTQPISFLNNILSTWLHQQEWSQFGLVFTFLLETTSTLRRPPGMDSPTNINFHRQLIQNIDSCTRHIYGEQIKENLYVLIVFVCV